MAAQIYEPQLSVPVLEAPRVQRVDVSSAIQAFAEAAKDREARVVNDSALAATTRLEQAKLEADAQPWEQRAKHFQDAATKIKADLSGGLNFFDRFNPEIRTGFEGSFAKLSGLAQIDVNASAERGRKEHVVGAMEQGIFEMTKSASEAQSDGQRNFFMGEIGKSISNALQAGAINEAQAGDYGRTARRQVERNIVTRMISDPNVGPSQALQELSSGKFVNLRDEDQIMLQGHAEAKLQHQVAMSDHAAIVAERNRKLTGDQIAKEGFDLLRKGQMSEDWLATNKRVLDTSDFHMIVKEMQEGGGIDSAATVSDLFDRVYSKGEDIAPDLKEALGRREISVETARSLYNENKQTQDVQSPRKQGLSYIATALKVSDANDDPVAPQRLANAVAAFNQQMTEDPKQDPIALSRTLVRTQALLGWDQINVLRPLPKYAVGDRMTFDAKAARAATAKAFLAKYGGDRAKAASDPDFVREGKLINDWEAARNKLNAATEAAKARPK